MIGSVSASPFAGDTSIDGAATARDASATGAASAPKTSSLAIAYTISAYDAKGNARTFTGDQPPSLTRSPLAAHTREIVLNVTNGESTTVIARDDGTYAVERGGKVLYDSAQTDGAGPGDPTIGALGKRIAAFADSGGSATSLASAASAVTTAAEALTNTNDVSVTVTDAKGVSQYHVGADGTISAARTTAAVALETVSITSAGSVDSTRLRDGSGTTDVTSAGTDITIARAIDGTEHVSVHATASSTGYPSAGISSTITDALGDQIVVGAASGTSVTDGLGNVISASTAGGVQASLTSALSTDTTAREGIVESTSAIVDGNAVQSHAAYAAVALDNTPSSITIGAAISATQGQGGTPGGPPTEDDTATLHAGASVSGDVALTAGATAQALSAAHDQQGSLVPGAADGASGSGRAIIAGARDKQVASIEASVRTSEFHDPFGGSTYDEWQKAETSASVDILGNGNGRSSGALISMFGEQESIAEVSA